ncbi:MAG: ferritin-like domain-containing protein [Actinomycetota bacterium]|nr:ferritin-like domain-containing protein [Actinomycetota bacterium]|tara:strand:+ start:24699 stop:25874 length:1176 start_codon:yes stop_codon:yes gene_type:complete
MTTIETNQSLEEYANDPERITEYSVWNDDVTSLIHAVEDNADAIFTWGYDKGERAPLDRLYEKAKTSQWNGQTDLDWSIEVDPYTMLLPANPMEADYFKENPNSPLHKFSDKEWKELAVESLNWSLSQFMHGEQGALLCTAKIVETVPWIDAKYYASTQVVDEARHVEVFAQYLDQKMGGINYPVNYHLKCLLDDIIEDSRWDITYLGMQIMVEGLALAAFGFMHQTTEEPLLKKLLRYVMSDEARHVAFGVLSLQEIYKDMDAKEIRERQEFTFEAALRMRDRFLRQEMWEKLGVDVKEMVKYQLEMPEELKVFQRLLFSKIVPNCKKLGLLDAGDAWLRDRFTEIGVIEFEDWVDTGSEFEDFDLDKDLEEKDREVREAAHEIFHKEDA